MHKHLLAALLSATVLTSGAQAEFVNAFAYPQPKGEEEFFTVV